MELRQIDQFLRQEIKDLISDPDNWDAEQVLGSCKICETSISEQERFRLFADLDGTIRCMNFHYACSIIETHWSAFQEADIKGWIS